jgi:hypothetical protein
VFEQAVAGAPRGAPALPFGSGSVQSSRPALTCIIGARRAWIVPMISSTSTLQVNARRGDVRMPQLTLDDR